MNDEQRNALFDIVRNRLKPSELKELVDQVLGAGAFGDLSGEYDQYDAFLKRVELEKKENSLLEQVAKARPDIDLSTFNVPSPIAKKKRQGPKHVKPIPFTNRKPELDEVIDPKAGKHAHYYLFDAPFGYGKTALLDKLKQELDNLGWFCVYVSSENRRTISQIVEYLVEALGINSPTCIDDIYQSGIEIGQAVAEKHEQEPGLALLFDIDSTQDSFETVLKDLITKLIPGIWDGLAQDADFFRSKSSYRVVIAGRYLAPIVRKFEPSFYETTRLTPFNYDIARKMFARYVEKGLVVEKDLVKDETKRDKFVAHLLFYSGGHPDCMARILHILERYKGSPDKFFTSHRKQIKQIVRACANEVRWCINWTSVHGINYMQSAM